MDVNIILDGLWTALQPANLLWLLLGAVLGTIVGILPGLGAATGVAVLIPLTFGMEPVSALILMAAIYYGALFGGSRSSILINTPGDGSSIAATFDGYPMTKKGLAGQAMSIAAMASLIGGVMAIFGFIFLAIPLANFALNFGPAEFLLLFLFALSAVVTLSQGNIIKGFLTMFLGLGISTIGVDLQSGVHRFTFGLPHLTDGINFIVIIIGIYAIGEVLYNLLKPQYSGKSNGQDIGSKWFTKEQWKRSLAPIIRSGPIGFFLGVLPGSGGTIASLLSYSTEKQISKNKDEFGKGAVEGLVAPESANSASAVGSLIPMLTMGIPGSGTTAVMLGALVMIGITPGPLLFENSPDTIWTLINSMFIGNIILVIINILMVGMLVKILKTPPNVLYPIVLILSFLGAYTLGYSTIDFYILIIAGVIGLLMRILNYPVVPLILALIVGGDMEQNFQRAMIVYDSPMDILFASPIAIVLALLTVLSLCYPLIAKVFKRRKAVK
ncbi:tripartite tricarboxylate transporter TctA [Oceanobacillus oncorhynchi subsp. incaldanensis]|uniref:Tripartite tricarboxylate transporter TctA family protein n=2 Tax=Oceanobacillus TaxID=182709 RepID=A0A0A1MD35_9BACI|nr:tripartite tricarboxylate transporter permease [Oceanobacillus oncorhynchi]MDM8101766.1 tripartite tricarboxylate transporter permease [Oceanobacillus oncorhynchi]UUI41766.1 tripartite tricarboxylate transporter permease [Oceanobacillus oncorhynchi]GIO20458.1 tripartite tricarboxylate transporter TctA [Oceanobacillus oncorhynchi subsp. incaldanensis]CEI83265.1 Tripartite tricarboxylate transporter TctA family protein [Oceanobacillus oncorhynchi]